jgi:hypothetical protein
MSEHCNSEPPNEAAPADLIPLGTVHNDDRREHLIQTIDTAQKKGTIALWAYKGHHSAKLQRVPDTYELNWMGGPGREEADNPDYPGLAYYCDVTAEPRLRQDKPGAYVLHAGAATAEVFTQVLISEAVLEKLRATVGIDGASPRRRGPKPRLRLSIADRIFTDLRDERLTVGELEDRKLEALVADYGGSKNTANRARADACTRFSEFQKTKH